MVSGQEIDRFKDTVTQVLNASYSTGLLSKMQLEILSNNMSAALEAVGYES